MRSVSRARHVRTRCVAAGSVAAARTGRGGSRPDPHPSRPAVRGTHGRPAQRAQRGRVARRTRAGDQRAHHARRRARSQARHRRRSAHGGALLRREKASYAAETPREGGGGAAVDGCGDGGCRAAMEECRAASLRPGVPIKRSMRSSRVSSLAASTAIMLGLPSAARPVGCAGCTF